ncbi:MAG: restriction endonuclease [Candidatus Riflebacteria bacterium]|nr:restriction endonuclease [Candidatus Riflebacteria bacterium]
MPPIFVYSFESGCGDYGAADADDCGDYFRAKERSRFSSECPYCKLECHVNHASMEFSGGTGFQDDLLALCGRCGWWSFQSDREDLSGLGTFFSTEAVLKKFATESLDVPVDALVAELDETLDAVEPAHRPDVVAGVYSDMLGYKVECCSHGWPQSGIELMLMNLEPGGQLAIEIDRRTDDVQLGHVHQLLGASVDAGQPNGDFVATGFYLSLADPAAGRLEPRRAIRIDMISGKRLLESMGVLNSARREVTANDCPFWRDGPYLTR